MNTECGNRISTVLSEKRAGKGGVYTAGDYNCSAFDSIESAKNDTTSSPTTVAEEEIPPITPSISQATDSTNLQPCNDSATRTTSRLFSAGTGDFVDPGTQQPHSMMLAPPRHSVDSARCSTCGGQSPWECSSPQTLPLVHSPLTVVDRANYSFPNTAAVVSGGGGGGQNELDANRFTGRLPQSLPPSLDGTGRITNIFKIHQRAFSTMTGCNSLSSCSSATTRMRHSSLLQPLSSIEDPSMACAVREQNRNTIIAELERQRDCIHRQVAQLRRELSANNIFALVRASNASQLQYLLDKGLGNVNQRDYNGCTPLHVAAFEGNGAIVRVLVSFGADIMAIDNMGRTPLDWAAANRHSSVCRYLLASTKKHLLAQEKQQQANPPLNDEKNGACVSETSPTAGELPTVLSPEQHRDSLSHMGLPPSTAAAMECSPQQSTEFSSNYVLASLPPGVDAQLRLQAVAALGATNPVGTAATSITSHLDDDDDDDDMMQSGEDVCYLSEKFSSYTTVSDTVSLVVCMVGLPGRGKSFICHRLSRYLNWKGVPCRVFNAGNYRRQLLGVDGTADSCFYDPNNASGKALRDKMADLACEDLMDFISRHHVAVGVLDATNSTRERRRHLVDFFSKVAKQRKVVYRTIFIESICTDEIIITENILRSKCGNDDFKNVKDTSEVINSFRLRIAEYEKVYEPLDDSEDLSYIRIINVKHHVILKKIPCGLGSRIAFFLLNLHPVAYPIYIALPGETIGDHNHMYAGDERLTPLGEKYAEAMKKFILERYVPHMVVLHGTNPSVLNTLKPLSRVLGPDNYDEANKLDENEHAVASSIVCQEELLCPLPGLDSINYGHFSGRTAEWVRTKYARLSKILYSFSRGISLDSVTNLETSADSKVTPVSEEPQEENQKGCEQALQKQYPDNSKHAIFRFRHIPDHTDPRLSYCVQFPNGESCRQVNVRLEPALMAVMRVQGPVLVMASAVPAQGILAFFTDVMPEMSPTLRLPRHAVVEIGVKGDIIVHQLVESPDG